MPDGRAAYLQRVRNRMDRVDRMPPDIRAVVHDWGLSIVDAMLAGGVKKGKHMRHIIQRVLDETRGRADGKQSGSSQFGGMLGKIDRDGE